jgi:hypothetical protein
MEGYGSQLKLPISFRTFYVRHSDLGIPLAP